mmetsp:Transcript_22684/g.52427  ORF Transcript_22684/g.52427 Transcript_22684/m.52427 type:complete len:203 (-) Transcript_22684:668-1276(-)
MSVLSLRHNPRTNEPLLWSRCLWKAGLLVPGGLCTTASNLGEAICFDLKRRVLIAPGRSLQQAARQGSQQLFCWRGKVHIFRFFVKIFSRDGNDISRWNTSMRRPSLLILVVFKLDNDFLDHGRGSTELPDRRFAHFRTIEGSCFWKDCHAFCIFLEATFGTSRETHHMRPWQTNEFGGVVLVLDIIRLGIGIKPLDAGENP